MMLTAAMRWMLPVRKWSCDGGMPIRYAARRVCLRNPGLSAKIDHRVIMASWVVVY